MNSVSIVERGARVLGFDLTEDGAREIAGRARGTPRIAGRLLKRVRDFASVGRPRDGGCEDRRCRADPAGSGSQGAGCLRQALSAL